MPNTKLRIQQIRKARIRSFTQLNVDCAIWMLVILTAVILRFEFSPANITWGSIIILGFVAGALHVVIGSLMGLYSGKYRYGSFEEVSALTITLLIETIILTAGIMVVGLQFDIPRSTALIAFPLGLVLMFGLRYVGRMSREQTRKPKSNTAAALVVGAGDAGELIVRSMLKDIDSPLRPVGLLDDDPAKKNLKLRGVPMLGTTKDIANVAAETDAKVLVLAISNLDPTLIRKFTDEGIEAGLQVMIVPTVKHMLTNKVSVSELREIKIEDLLGRLPIDTRVEDVASFITGKRVLVTGAGGSIGSELCHQLHKFGPKELIMLDRDETGLQHAQLGTVGHGLLDTRDVVLADIREADTLLKIFADRKPEVVFHAAALKHLPMLEQYPEEAWKTNVLGTLNVLNAARSVGVHTFVNISTDKAANPTSVLGHSKRVAERITAWAAEDSQLRYLSVRFGNVIGSRGSMLPTFQSLINSGGPVTVTHPEATRYFMTIPEACQLVIQAGGIGRSGEVLILDMGQPVRILDIAKRMITMSGKKIEIVFTGLREGEKLHEELVGSNEILERPFHPQISHTVIKPISPQKIELTGWMKRMGVLSDTPEQRQDATAGSQ